MALSYRGPGVDFCSVCGGCVGVDCLLEYGRTHSDAVRCSVCGASSFLSPPDDDECGDAYTFRPRAELPVLPRFVDYVITQRTTTLDGFTFGKEPTELGAPYTLRFAALFVAVWVAGPLGLVAELVGRAAGLAHALADWCDRATHWRLTAWMSLRQVHVRHDDSAPDP